jgi:glycerol uptake facilitator-like aquaporin
MLRSPSRGGKVELIIEIFLVLILISYIRQTGISLNPYRHIELRINLTNF